MRKFLGLVLIVLLPFCAILTTLDVFYSYSITRHPLYGIPKNRRFDYLIIGDSRVSSILEDRLSYLTGGSAMVIPVSGGGLDDLNKVIGHFFDMGNRAKTVVTSIDLRIGGNLGMKHEWLFYAYDSGKRHYMNPRVPFEMYARNNKDVTIRKIFRYFTGEPDTSRADRRDMSIVQWYKPHRDQIKDYSTTPFRMDALDSLAELLRTHGVYDHRLLIAPLSPEFDTHQSDPDAYKAALNSRGFRLYDCSDRFTDTSDFADLVHLKRSRYPDFTQSLADSLRPPTPDR